MSDTEVERIMAGRPPSSYGSMCSDEPEDDEIQDAPQPIITINLPTKVTLHRPDSPETAITSVTHDRRNSVWNEGVYLTPQSGAGMCVQVPSYSNEQDSMIMETEDNEDGVHVNEPQHQERTVQVEQSIPEPTVPTAASSENELDLRYIFTEMLHSLQTLNALELQSFVRSLRSQRRDQVVEFHQLEQEGVIDVLGVVDAMLEKWDRCEALYFTTRVLYEINKPIIAAALESKGSRALVQYDVTTTHKRRFYNLYEGTCRPGKQRYIRHVYVESPIMLEFPATEGPRKIRTSELFTPREGEGRPHVVVTMGIPAVGLSVATQMLIMDWTEKKACQEFDFVFVLPGRDLHLIKNTELTFLEFLASFYPEAKRAEFLSCQDCTMLFVIDGLDLCKQPLDFPNNQSVTEVTAPALADVLLTSLIKGDMLPHACIWITSSRSTLRKIPANCISRLTELKGFENAQKEEYFTKRTKDPSLGLRVLEYVKGSPRLYDACYLPFLSWIVAFIYEWRLQDVHYPEPMPVLATFYAQYVIVLTNRKIEHYSALGVDASRWRHADRDFLMKMGELALKMLRDEQNVFYEDTVSRLSLNIDDITHQGGISSETGEPSRENGRSFRFVRPCIQQFMAAQYVYVKFRLTGENALESHRNWLKTDRNIHELFKPAINLTLAKRDGSWDLFLHFLFGLATRITETQLRGHLLPQYHPEPKGIDDVLKYTRKKIKENCMPERCRNLELCLKDMEQGRITQSDVR